MTDVVMGLDLGTGGVRVIAVDLTGQVIAQSTQPYPLLTPQPGWTEQQPQDWLAASRAALTTVAQQVASDRVLALGLSGQMHGMVALDSAGQVIRPAILWNDQRTGQAVADIEAVVPRDVLIQRTGNPAITGFQLPKLIWLRSQEPEAYAQLHQMLLPKDYVGYWLTGEFRTEPSDASGIGCLHLATRQWDTDILEALHLKPEWFPSVIASTAIAGFLQAAIAEQVGLPAGLPIVAGGGDNAAAAIGLGLSSAHRQRGSLSLGTSGVIFAPCAEPVPDPQGRVHLFCHADGGYHLLGVTLAAGGALRWYRDQFAAERSYPELMELAAHSPPGSRGILFLPHLAGERSPYLDPDSRGAWINLSLAHTQADVTRAVLEGVAFSLRAALEVITPLAPMHQLLATGGGARSETWLQIVADVLQTELVAPTAEEGAAYGAAILAMVGVGVFADLDTAFQQVLSSAGLTVRPQSAPAYDAAFQRYQKLYTLLQAVR